MRLDKLGSELPLETKAESIAIAQRFRRWLKNGRIDKRIVYNPVARQVVERLLYPLGNMSSPNNIMGCIDPEVR